MLLSPEAVLKLDGCSLSSSFAENGQANFWRHLQRLVSQPNLSLHQVRHALKPKMLDLQRRGHDVTAFLTALDDPEAVKHLDHLGLWLVFRTGACTDLAAGESWMDHFILIETASRPLNDSIRAGDFAGAAQLGRATEILREYLTEEAWGQLEKARALEEAFLSRVVGVLDGLVANMAWTERYLKRNSPDFEGFQELMGFQAEKDIGRWLMKQLSCMAGVETNELYRLSEGAERGGVDERSFHRWVSGASFPNVKKLADVVEAISQSIQRQGQNALDMDLIGSLYRVSHRLLSMARVIQPFWGVDPATAAHADWTRLIGFERQQDWLQARYAFWTDHWSKNPQPQVKLGGLT